MFQKHRVEIITFAVAVVAAISVFAVIEARKPDGGLLVYVMGSAEVHNKESGEIVLEGPSKRRAVLNYVERARNFGDSGIRPIIPRNDSGANEGRSSGRRRSRIDGADLGLVDFSRADLAGIRMRDAWCNGALFREAVLLEARLEGTRFVDADFRGATISMADFGGADLSGAVLVNVIALGTNFHGANLTGCDLSGADLTYADFRGANLAGVKFDDTTVFTGVKLGDAQNLPDGLRARAEQAK